jgi:diacylglycerol kinase family enzyme
MRSLLLIANPAASRFTGGLHRTVVARLSRAYEVETAWPTSAGGVEARALQAAHEGTNIVVAMGGDGVVHHVVNGIVGTETTLGIIPAGTTNVLARILGIPARPAKAASYLASQPPAVRTALARISVETANSMTVRYATFATGLGFDAEVVRLSNLEPYRKYRFGSVHYARSAASVVLSRDGRPAPTMRVQAGERSADAAAVLIQIHDPYTYFGRLRLRVSTAPHEGLAVLLIERLSFTNMPRILAAAVTGRDLSSIGGVDVWPDVPEVEVWSDPPSPLQADGESLGSPGVVRFSALPHGLRVVAPIGD